MSKMYQTDEELLYKDETIVKALKKVNRIKTKKGKARINPMLVRKDDV